MLRKIKIKLRNSFYEAAGKYALKKGLTKRFMNLGYKGAALDLKPTDIDEKLNFQLYNAICSGVDLSDKSVIEIGCGRGGGCYFLKEYKKAGKVVGIDLSESNVKLATKLVGREHITFICESAEKIIMPQQLFYGVVNLESSHCYANKKAFLENVNGLLKPGGFFMYADIFVSANLSKIKSFLSNAGFIIEKEENITKGVIESLNDRSAERVSYFKKYIVPIFFKSFYGYKQSTIYKELNTGEKEYISFICRKQG